MPGHLHISPNSYFLGFEWNILKYDPSNHDGDDGNHERCAYVKVWKKVLSSQEGDGKPEGTPHLVHFILWSRDDDEDLKMERSSEAKPVTTDWADPKIPISQFPAGLLGKARM